MNVHAWGMSTRVAGWMVLWMLLWNLAIDFIPTRSSHAFPRCEPGHRMPENGSILGNVFPKPNDS